MLEECLALYITPMVDGWKVKITMVYSGLVFNVCSNHFLTELQEKYVELPPLKYATFRIWAYDSSSKKPLSIANLMITTCV